MKFYEITSIIFGSDDSRINAKVCSSSSFCNNFRSPNQINNFYVIIVLRLKEMKVILEELAKGKRLDQVVRKNTLQHFFETGNVLEFLVCFFFKA